MPFRHAHFWLIALVPVILIAFWPGYFGQLRSAPFALHAHGITASAWIVLTAMQSWSIHNGRRALHRTMGLAVFAIVPLFAAASLLAMQGGVLLARAHSDPFHEAYGARLTLCDLLAAAIFLILVHFALAQRRRVERHAAAMLSTVLLVLPPVLARVFPIPVFLMFPGSMQGGLWVFEPSFHLAEAVSAVIALYLAAHHRSAAFPFLIVAVGDAVQMGIMAGARPLGLEDAALLLADVPPAILTATGLAVGMIAVVTGWRPRIAPRRRVAGV